MQYPDTCVRDRLPLQCLLFGFSEFECCNLMVLWAVATEEGTDVFFDEVGEFFATTCAIEETIAFDAGVVESGECFDDGIVDGTDVGEEEG